MSLSLSHVSRKYGERLALDDVSFEVNPGRLTGFVGGNGAGKTTAMRIILGVLAANQGEVLFNNRPLSDRERRSFGYMPEERGLYPKMPVEEQLIFFASLHGFSPAQAKQQAGYLIEALGLTERAHDPVESLSLGNQQRAQIAVSLVHRPQALVLDEPFSGLDPMAVDVIVSLLAERAAEGIPVLLSSHQLDVVERLCDDLVIIAGGRIRATGTIASLQQQYSPDLYRIETGGDIGWIRSLPGVTAHELAANAAVIEIGSPSAPRDVLTAALERGEVCEFSRQSIALSEIFREVVEETPSAHEVTA